MRCWASESIPTPAVYWPVSATRYLGRPSCRRPLVIVCVTQRTIVCGVRSLSLPVYAHGSHVEVALVTLDTRSWDNRGSHHGCHRGRFRGRVSTPT